MLNIKNFFVKVFYPTLLNFSNKRIGKRLYIIFIILFGVLLINKTLEKDKLFNDYDGIRNVINADASGYYVYLPAFFIYNFKTNNFPDSISQHSGNGFTLNNNKVKSKYPLGVAIAYTPFFLTAHLLADNKNGFSPPYHRAARIAGVFYCILGLIFCFLLFSQYVNYLIAFVSLIPLFYGTNLIYFTLLEPVYSHVLSFCLIAGFILCLHYVKINKNRWCKWLLPLFLGFIISVRMTNGIVIFLIPFWNIKRFKDIIEYPKRIIKD